MQEESDMVAAKRLEHANYYQCRRYDLDNRQRQYREDALTGEVKS
jgi:hypothetical protein